jgi:hypothetical protein
MNSWFIMCKHPSSHTHMHSYRIVRGSNASRVWSSRGGCVAGGAISGRTRGLGARRWSTRVLGPPTFVLSERQAPEHLLPMVCKYLTCVLLCLMHYVIGVAWNRWCISTILYSLTTMIYPVTLLSLVSKYMLSHA